MPPSTSVFLFSNYTQKFYKLNLEFNTYEKVEKITISSSDFPIFIKSQSQNAKTIMLCAMGPLPPRPKESDNCKRDTIEFGHHLV
jgi:hypothetical protein